MDCIRNFYEGDDTVWLALCRSRLAHRINAMFHDIDRIDTAETNGEEAEETYRRDW